MTPQSQTDEAERVSCPNCGRTRLASPGKYQCVKCGHRFRVTDDEGDQAASSCGVVR